jgi:hypothetical protein
MPRRTNKSSPEAAKPDVLVGVTDFEIASLATQISGLPKKGPPMRCVREAIELLLYVAATRKNIDPAKVEPWVRYLEIKNTYPREAKRINAAEARKKILEGRNSSYWNPRFTEYLKQEHPGLSEALEKEDSRIREDQLDLIKEDFFERWMSQRRKNAARANASIPRKKGIGRIC